MLGVIFRKQRLSADALGTSYAIPDFLYICAPPLLLRACSRLHPLDSKQVPNCNRPLFTMSLNTSSYVGVAEKNVGTTDAHRIHTHRYVEGTGNIQVLKSYDSDGLKFARDGKTILIPQPSGDIDDPLNWRLAKKHLVLVSLIFASLVSLTLSH